MRKNQPVVVLLAVALCLVVMFSFAGPPGQMNTQQNSAKIIAFNNVNEGHSVSACQPANGEEVVLVFDQTVIANSSNDIAYYIGAGPAPDNPSAEDLHLGLNHRTNMINTDRRATGESLYKRDAYQWRSNTMFSSFRYDRHGVMIC